MSAHAELRAAVVAAVEDVADQLADNEPPLVVRRAVTTCPAALALDGETPFEDSPAVAGRAATATVLDRIVTGHLDPSRARPPTTPAAGFRTALQEAAVLEWPWPWVDSSDRPVRAVTAAEVHRRASAAARMLPSWPPPQAVFPRRQPSWTFPGRPLKLHARLDLVLGRRDGTHTTVVVLNGDHGPDTRAALAYLAVVEALDQHRPAATILGLLPDAGRRWSVPVDEDLLADGVAAAGLAARAALGARRNDAAGLERRPGRRCRWCAHAAGCGPAEAWLAGPGRLRHGFLPVTPSG
jgi:hypothetical protein